MTKLSKKALFEESVFLPDLEIGFHGEKHPEKVIQFGEGNFLRAFIDLFIDESNDRNLFKGSIVVVPPILDTTDFANKLTAQDNCYTVVLRGLQDKVPTIQKKIVSSVSRTIDMFTNFDEYMDAISNPHLRYIVSNTTEAGIVYVETDKPKCDVKEPPISFPAKITALLFRRYEVFEGAADKGFIFIPCELIDNNGTKLKETVLQHASDWELPQDFVDWVQTYNHFTNTLVDRIVTGYPKDEVEKLDAELGYHDDLLVTGELFHFFAIEADEKAKKEIEDAFSFHKAGLNVVLTDDVTPYKIRKVRILNGAHTMSVLAAFLSGKDTVLEMMDDELFVEFLKAGIFEEIIPSVIMYQQKEGVVSLTVEDLASFASSVFDRFANPHIKHYLLSIALNSVSKFRARLLPSILDYQQGKGEIPPVLTFSFAALLAFYQGAKGAGNKENRKYEVQDAAEVMEVIEKAKEDNFAEIILQSEELWGMDLNELPGFAEAVKKYLEGIHTNGIEPEIKKLIE